MKKSIIMSLIMIVMAVTVISGATLAWFTDEAEPIVNEFTAGTVSISADETIEPDISMAENWNPGDVAQKEYTIINDGTKGSYVRVILTGQWFNQDGTEFIPESDVDVVTWTTEDENWIREDNVWYYDQSVAGSYTQENEEDRTITLNIDVSLDGPGTGNEYQGKVFKLTASFEAVQSSNNAVHDVWVGNPYPVIE